MRVALVAAGTRGDVQPMLALGQALRSKGHAVVVAAAPCFAEESALHGVVFQAMGRDVEVWLREEAPLAVTPLALFRLLNSAITESMHAQFDVLPRIIADADVVVAAGASLAACSVAQAFGVPYRYVAFSAQSLRSRAHLPTVSPFQNAPKCLNGAAWWATSWFYDRLLLAPLNLRRRALELAPVDQVISAFMPSGEVVLAADAELSAMPEGSSVLSTGAWALDDSRALPVSLLAFLDERTDKPLFASFGSMPDGAPTATAATLIRAARTAGQRLIIGGAAACVEDASDVHCLRGPVSHAALFARVSVVIHHGGAGTTATAARAGLPQIIVPHGGDQFGFARRAHSLGIAPEPLRREALEHLGHALRETGGCVEPAKALGRTLATRDGRTVMVDHLEALARYNPRPDGQSH